MYQIYFKIPLEEEKSISSVQSELTMEHKKVFKKCCFILKTKTFKFKKVAFIAFNAQLELTFFLRV